MAIYVIMIILIELLGRTLFVLLINQINSLFILYSQEFLLDDRDVNVESSVLKYNSSSDEYSLELKSSDTELFFEKKFDDYWYRYATNISLKCYSKYCTTRFLQGIRSEDKIIFRVAQDYRYNSKCDDNKPVTLITKYYVDNDKINSSDPLYGYMNKFSWTSSTLVKAIAVKYNFKCRKLEAIRTSTSAHYPYF